ncbi:hypothetical protein VKT23_016779 [Stygiomarasmius scandens]|uniref:Protein kinase domain-containing protein n=1 Tax=Marasmiellus scandens TaxID=2682957 RepID=A0ABR1ITV7_9AGAR
MESLLTNNSKELKRCSTFACHGMAWHTRLPLPVLCTVFSGLLAVLVLRPHTATSDPDHRDSFEEPPLPSTLAQWRNYQPGERLWESLRRPLLKVGLDLWQHAYSMTLAPLDQVARRQTGYLFVHTQRQDIKRMEAGFLGKLRMFQYKNTLYRPARTTEGQDVMVRIISINRAGSEHLDILRRIATGQASLISGNHSLPLLREIKYNNVIFGVFPLVGSSLDEASLLWVQNSVGDVMDMILQALEGLSFIHNLGIAHRNFVQDVFLDNFLVQWQPESLLSADTFTSRPRVYLIDFEAAVQLPREGPSELRLCRGLPVGGSYIEPSSYTRPSPPDVEAGEAYDPFKLDVWQLGFALSSIHRLMTGHEEIDSLLLAFANNDPNSRISSEVALRRLMKATKTAPLSCLEARATWKR